MGATPHTVRCNMKVQCRSNCLCFFFSSELAGGTPHTVRCNMKVGLTIFVVVVFFFHLNWRVGYLIQSDVTTNNL